MLPLNVDADVALRAASVIPSLVMAVFLSVVATAVAAVALRPSALGRYADGTARNVGLALSEQMRPAVIDRVRRRILGACIGAAVGSFAGVGLSALVPKNELVEGAPSIWLVLGGAFAGMGVGVMLTAVGRRGALGPDAPRIARLDSVSLVDYVHPLERNGSRILIGIAVLLTLVALGFALTGGLNEAGAATIAAPALLTLTALVCLLVFEVGGRRVVSRGRPASSAEELAWDDALRAQSLRDMLQGPLYSGSYLILVLSIALRDAMSGTETWWLGLAGSVLSAIVGLGVILVFIALEARRPQQHFLRRLWPEVAVGGEQLAEARQYPVAGVDAATSASRGGAR